MPCNMAVERPDSWIISVVLDDNMAGRAQHLDISSLGVGGIRDRYTIPEAGTLVEDVHIVAVQVHWLVH